MSARWLALAGLFCVGLLGTACSAPDGGSDGSMDGGNGDGDGPQLGIRCESSELAKAGLRRLTAGEFERSVRDIFPEIAPNWAGVAMGADPVGPSGFTTDSSSLLVGQQSAEEIYRTALEFSALVAAEENLSVILPCSTTAPDSACGATFVDTYASSIYRMPLSDVERNELTAYFDSVLARSDFAMAIKWTLVTMLQSPFFVYRSEVGDAEGKLSAHELATQMSYSFAGTTPSADLLGRAVAGEFSSPEARVAWASEMLATEPGRALLDDFLVQWTGYQAVRGVSKDGIENFAEVRELMVLEMQAFLEKVIVTDQGGVKELLTAPFTFADPTLGTHYGLTAGDTLGQVERPVGQGIGLLAQGALLAAQAHPNMSSPVKRGLFVFNDLLCGQIPPIPDEVPPIEAAPPANTTRERFENSHGNEPCHSCHATFEPFGFALEAYDAAGRYRTEEAGFPINTVAEALLPDGSQLSITSLEDMAQKLAELPLVADCVSGKLATYVYSGGGGETCLAEPERDALKAGTVGLLAYYASLAGAPSMERRAR